MFGNYQQWYSLHSKLEEIISYVDIYVFHREEKKLSSCQILTIAVGPSVPVNTYKTVYSN